MSGAAEWACPECTVINTAAHTLCSCCGADKPGFKPKAGAAAPAPGVGAGAGAAAGAGAGGAAPAKAGVECPQCGGAHDLGACPYTVKADDSKQKGDAKKADGDAKAKDDDKKADGKSANTRKPERIPPPIDRVITVTFDLPKPGVAPAPAAVPAPAPAPAKRADPAPSPAAADPAKAGGGKAGDGKAGDAKGGAADGKDADGKPVRLPEIVSELPAATDNDVPNDDPTHAKLLTQILTADNEWKTVPWACVRPGHVVRVAQKEKAPADLVLVRCATANNDCYIQTTVFDGDQKLRMRKAAPVSKELFRFAGDGNRKGAELQAFATKQLHDNLKFRVSAPCKRVPKFYGVWVRDAVGREERLEIDNFMPRGGLLLLCDWVVGVAVYTGRDTKFGLIGGTSGARVRELNRQKKADAEKEKAKVKAEERKKKNAAEQVPAEKRIAAFEADSGMRWKNVFTDVPDDGNCLITAFWLGLTTLIRHYPAYALPEDKDLPKSAAEFRTQLFARLKRDAEYVSSITGLLQLYVEQIEESMLLGMEDFFVLPELIRTKILATKAALYQAGASAGIPQGMAGTAGAGGAAPKEALALIDYKEMTESLISAMSEGVQPRNAQGQAIGKVSYVPLGGQELTALCRMYRVRLQTMSTTSLFKSMSAVTVDEVDPRAVPPADVHEFDRSQKRIVRLLNIKSNHYNVHLPIAPDSDENGDAPPPRPAPAVPAPAAEAKQPKPAAPSASAAAAPAGTNAPSVASAAASEKAAFSAYNYWSDSMITPPSDLPPL